MLRLMQGRWLPRDDPMFVEELNDVRGTMWGWIASACCCRGSGSSGTGGGPQQNQGGYVNNYKLNCSMATINGKGQKQLTQPELLSLIQSYLGSSLFRHAMRYESLVHSHANYLDFIHEKVPLQTNLPTPQEKYVFASLFKDVEAKLILNVYLARMLQCRNTLICLAMDSDVPIEEDKFYLLAIVFQSKEAAGLWRSEYSFLTQVKVAQPYRSTHKVSLHSTTTLLVTRPENITVQAKFRLDNYTTDTVRAHGNSKFKERRYIEALYEYQFGLGLAHSPESKRERAILYANSSQCLFEMRLYQSALVYADISMTIDQKYAKGVYRKLMCYLELRDFKQAPTALRAINEICGPSQFETAQQMLCKYSLHHHGLYDWRQIFKGNNLQFGEYCCSSVQVKDEPEIQGMLESVQSYFVAGKDIAQHELVMFCKPIIYCGSEQEKFGENYSIIINDIMTYCDLEDNFYDIFQELPSQCQFQGHVLKFNKLCAQGIEVNEIHAKCLRCLELEKVIGLDPGQKECLGIWEQLYRFKHECLSNCTYIHIKGGLAVFAVRDIKQGEHLTIDFLNWQTSRREVLMIEKLGVSCDCSFCKWEWDTDFHSRSGQILYAFYKHETREWRESGFEKLSLFYLWNLVYVKNYKEVELMQEYLEILERYPLWECVINCLKYLRVRPRNDVFDFTKSIIKKLFQKYFKMNHSQAVELLKAVL